MNYLQYIKKQQGIEPTRFLLSGMDIGVRQLLGQHMIHFCQEQELTLFIVDHTQEDRFFTIPDLDFHVIRVPNDKVMLCSDLLEAVSLYDVSRIRVLLSGLGFQESRIMKVITYLRFVKETQYRLGDHGPLRIATLETYGSMHLVEEKLRQLERKGALSAENVDYLMGRYSEISREAAEFETFLIMLEPFLEGKIPDLHTIIHLPFGSFDADAGMQKLISRLMISYMKEHPGQCAMLILDDGMGERDFLTDILSHVPGSMPVYLLSDDAFSLDDQQINIVMNAFPIRIYTRHADMRSCAKVAECCGQIDVIHKAYTVTVDHHLKANSAWDMLLGTNHSESEIRNAPVKEYRFPKETIHAMAEGTGIIDCKGSKVWFAFDHNA